jgi:transposase-like protein
VVIEGGRPIAHVARDLGVPAETLRRYVRQVEADEGLRRAWCSSVSSVRSTGSATLARTYETLRVRVA